MGESTVECFCNCIGGVLVSLLCCPCISAYFCLMSLYPGMNQSNTIAKECFDSDLLNDTQLGCCHPILSSWLHLGYGYEDDPDIKEKMTTIVRNEIWREICNNNLNNILNELPRNKLIFIAKQIRYYLQTSILFAHEDKALFWNPSAKVDGIIASQHIERYITEKRCSLDQAQYEFMLKYPDNFTEFNLVELTPSTLGFTWTAAPLNKILAIQFRNKITEININGVKRNLNYNTNVQGEIAALRKRYADIVIKIINNQVYLESNIFAEIINNL